MTARLTAILLSMSSSLVFAGEKITELRGEAYDLESDKFLYYEDHKLSFDGDSLIADEVTYTNAAGEIVGRKSLDFSASKFVPNFRNESGCGHVEGIRREAGDIVMYRQKEGDKEEKTKKVKNYEALAADAGFNAYVQSRFDDLLDQDTIKFRIAAASQMMTVKFKAERIADSKIEATPVVNFKVSINSFISMFIDPLTLSYDPQTRYLVEYKGTSNMRDENCELYKVRIRYPQFVKKAVSEEPAS